jgi:hypothetical protein
MKPLIILFATIALPFAVQARPIITIANPKNNANLVVGITAASGAAKSTHAITDVFYSLNGSPWAQAAGTTNWSVANLQLMAGLNTFSAYAVDSANSTSLTAKVSFTYVVMTHVSMTISPSNTWGSVSITNGELLQIGKQYTLSARAARGFMFAGWTCDGTNLPHAGPTISFPMSSNLTFMASFSDVTKPLCVITYPAVGHVVTNSVAGTIKATDSLVGIGNVFYQINGNGWVLATPRGDGMTWATPGLAVSAGANTLQAWATNTAGLGSTTNKVRFQGDIVTPPGPAPASLEGLAGAITNEDGSTEQISFGQSTYATANEVGNYSYVLLSSNTAAVDALVMAPPDKAGLTNSMVWTFSSANTFTTTDEAGNQMTGSLFPVSNLVLSPSAACTVAWTNTGASGAIVFGGGAFTNTITPEGQAAQTQWGTYTLEDFSPVSSLMQMSYTDPADAGQTAYSVHTFSGTNTGIWFTSTFDTSGNLESVSAGGFTVLSSASPPAGKAPMSIEGQTWSFTSQEGHPTSVAFGAYTYDKFDAYTNDDSTVIGDYTYMKTGPDTAQAITYRIAPPGSSSASGSVAYLTFSPSTATMVRTNSDGTVKTTTFSLGTAKNYAPASLAGRTFTSGGGTLSFNTDGTATYSKPGENTKTSPYTYARYSPEGGMVTTIKDDGSTGYLQLRFTSAGGGGWYETDVDTNGNVSSVESGTFTMK